MDEERVFRGSKMQRGYGLGGFFAKLWRSARPLLRRGGEYIGKKAIRTGLHTIQDIAAGNNPRAALKLSLIHISEPTRLLSISYAVFCLKKKKKKMISRIY